MNVVHLDQDCELMDWPSFQAWATSTSAAGSGSTVSVSSDGNVYDKFATCDIRANTGTVTADHIMGAGIHMEPADDADVAYTPYRVKCSCFSLHGGTLTPCLFVGESPASVTGTNDNVTVCRMIKAGDGARLDYDDIIAMPVNTADRAVCFFIGLVDLGAGSANLRAYGHLSVRRLLGPGVGVIDYRKQ